MTHITTEVSMVSSLKGKKTTLYNLHLCNNLIFVINMQSSFILELNSEFAFELLSLTCCSIFTELNGLPTMPFDYLL